MWIKEINDLVKLGLILVGKIIEKQIKIREEYLLNNVNQTTKGNLQFDWGLIKVNEVIDNLREDHYLIKLID